MGSWIKREGWLKGYVSEKSKPVENNDETNKDADTKTTIVRLILKCPQCKSIKLKCYGAARPVLYYRCNDCGWKFKVIEVDKI